jgi:hypothetical protein
VTVLLVVLTVLVAAEFLFAPVNLWTGRTMDNYRRYTGLPDRFATHVLAPVKLATAVAVIAGLFVRPVGVAGAAAAVLISAFYLVRLAGRDRRDPTGFLAFTIFGALGAGLLVVRLYR